MGKKQLEVMNQIVTDSLEELKRVLYLPLVSVCIPLRNSGQHINTMIDSLYQQDYPNFEIVIAVGPGDTTLEYLDEKYRNDPRIRFVEAEIPADLKGRDANRKRNAAAQAAQGEILAFTDAKITQDPDWISHSVYLMRRENVQALGGLMISTPEQKDSFLAMFTDGALLTRVPQFGKGFLLTNKNSGRTNDFPVTSCLFVTKEAYLATTVSDKLRFWGFPPAEYSYEDFMFVQSLLDVGIGVFCTSEIKVYHKHRTQFRKMMLEYLRSGLGAAQMYEWYPKSAFARGRLFQVNAVTVAFLMTLISMLYGVLFGQPEILVALFSLAAVGLTGLGFVNALKVRHWYGLFFPPLTGFFIVVFAAGFTLYHRLHMADPDRFLQTIWNFNWNMEL